MLDIMLHRVGGWSKQDDFALYINFVNGPDQIVYIVPDGVIVRTLERQRVRVPPFRFEVTTLGKLIIQLPLSWYTSQWTVMHDGWEGNRKSIVSRPCITGQ